MAAVNQQMPLQGLNIYTDKKRRTVYYNPILKKAFRVPSTDFKRFRMFQSRYISVLAVFLICFLIFHDWLHLSIWPAVLIGAIALVIFEGLWFKFLNSLPPYQGFDRSKLTSSYEVTITASDKKKAIVRIVLLIVIGILLVINAYQLHYEPGLLIACWIAMVLLFGYAGFQVWQLSKATIKS